MSLRCNVFIGIIPFYLSGCFNISLLINSITYLLGFESWNQYNSNLEDLKNGKERPIFDKKILILIWLICIILSDKSVIIWLLMCPVVYLSGNSTPMKETLMTYGVFIHYHFLKIPIDISILRHSITGSIQDLRDVEGDKAIGRVTLPIIFNFQIYYSCLMILFYFIDSIPIHSIMTYLLITIFGIQYPHLCYKLWQLNYILELTMKCNN